MTPGFRFDEAFEEQAARSPEAVALRAPEGTVTYAGLEARANRVANSLRAAGVGVGGFVGLHLERSIDAVAALLGILKAGAAAVPLPPAWPAERIAEILRFARLDALIDTDATPLAAPVDTRTVLLADALRGDPARPPRRADGERPAFVISSSGSTGTPKMIARSHASFHHRLRWTWEQHPYAAHEVCVQKSFAATTHAVYELFEPLLRGVAVRIIPDESTRDLAAFWRLLATEGVTRLLIVPSMLQASLDLPQFRAPPLRVLILMGEHVPARLAARVSAAFPAATKIFSIYGSTEASSTLISDLRLPRAPDDDPPLGRPISADVRASVLDAEFQPVAPGGTGMLFIGGSPLFTEYFRNPAGTEAVLVAPRGTERLYRTGDQVHVREDGNLVFAGRADGIVKVRGFRVDLGEVEQCLGRAPGVEQGVVAPHPDAASAATLVAFVTPADVATAPIFAWLRSHLPAYMLPSTVVALDEFPRSPSGKVDRLRLVRDHRLGAGVAPATHYESDTERAVGAIWSELLGVPAIERDRSFFEIGGTSLTVFAAAHRLREAFGLTVEQLGVAAFYASPTLAGVAAAIDQARRGVGPAVTISNEAALVPLRRGEGRDRSPLFVIPPAGGTLGAYERVVRALRTSRDVIGLRDPFLDGARDPTEGFQRWVRCYTDAVRRRQSVGPYHLLAYSSAGAFGFEIAQQLRAHGEDVALLALVDPVGMDFLSPRRFGYWALRARYSRPAVRRIIRWAGEARAVLPRVLRSRYNPGHLDDWRLSRAEFEDHASWSTTDRDNILRFAALLELNTGRPFAIAAHELDAVAPSGYLDALLARVAQVDATIDPEMIRRAVVLYELQVRSQHRYRLRRYDGAVHLFEVAGPDEGLIAAQLRPFVRTLHVRALDLGGLSDHTRRLLEPLPQSLHSHYGCMRTAAFSEGLAAQLDALLAAAPPTSVS